MFRAKSSVLLSPDGGVDQIYRPLSTGDLTRDPQRLRCLFASDSLVLWRETLKERKSPSLKMSGHSRKEQWCAIKFCVKLGKSAMETYDLLQNAYDMNSLKRPTVVDWHRRFVEMRQHQAESSSLSAQNFGSISIQEDQGNLSDTSRDDGSATIRELTDTIHSLQGGSSAREFASVKVGIPSVSHRMQPSIFGMDDRGPEESIYSNPIRSYNVTNPNLPTVDFNARKENCCDKFLTCLSHVPCASLIAWIILLLGLGGLTGSLLYGVTKCRKVFEDGTFWWFMEFTVIGVVVIMFVLGTLFLVIAHLSSDPTNRYVFNTSKKNMCARGLNVFVLFVAYFLAVIWVAGSSLAVMPLLVSTFILSTDFKKGDCIELKYYGLDKKICDPELEIFLKEGKELFTCYIFTYVSSVLVTISMIHFLISISANYTHLKDSRFATYNAYDTEEVRNSKHSILDTNM